MIKIVGSANQVICFASNLLNVQVRVGIYRDAFCNTLPLRNVSDSLKYWFVADIGKTRVHSSILNDTLLCGTFLQISGAHHRSINNTNITRQSAGPLAKVFTRMAIMVVVGDSSSVIVIAASRTIVILGGVAIVSLVMTSSWSHHFLVVLVLILIRIS